MSQHLQREIEKLKQMIVSVGAMAEESLRRAVAAFQERDRTLARSVIVDDVKLDRMEIDVEEEGLKVLALHQPVAIDLRFIIAVLKMNRDLERVGDLSANIAERAIDLLAAEEPAEAFDLSDMAAKVQDMLKLCLDALVGLDSGLAQRVCASDNEVDDLNRQVYQWARQQMRRSPGSSANLLCFLSVSHCLERIADHATNIAKDVIYMLEGEIVRHRGATP